MGDVRWLAVNANYVREGKSYLTIAVGCTGGRHRSVALTERLSNEVTARTRATNQKIADRFTRLAHEQIESLCAWLDAQAPPAKSIDQIERAADAVREPASLSY